MRIALSTFEYDRNLIGGAGIYALELSRWLAPFCQLTVQSCDAYKTPPDAFAAAWFGAGVPNVRYRQLPRPLRGHGVAAFYYYALARERFEGCDVHLINDLSQGVAIHRNAPLVQILHHLPSSELQQLPLSKSRIAITMFAALEKRALQRAQVIICDSSDTMAQALARYPENVEKLRVIPNGVDVNLFTPADIPTEDAVAEKPLVACVARGLEARKGLAYLIEALAVAQRVTPVELVIVGKDSQQVKSRMLAHARALGVIDVVTLVDSVSMHDLIALYQRATVTVVPSLLEGFSRPALESMACGTPVIGTAVGAIPELVDESSGVLVTPGDAGALAAALIDILQDDRRVKRMGAAARRRAVTLFAWDNVVKRVLSACVEATLA
ncbi:MAG: glycosyltransferase family 4 protein [Halobacteriota archaeon]